MKVQELLMNIKNKEFKLETGLEVKKYLPIEVKKTIAKGIIYDCTNDNEGATMIDSVERYMSYVRYMITMHTNLEYTDEDYDALCSTQYDDTTLLNAIMDCFGDDAKECTRILNLVTDDFMQTMSIEFNVAKLLNTLSGSLNGLVEKIGNIDLASMLPENVDMKKLGKFLDKYVK